MNSSAVFLMGMMFGLGVALLVIIVFNTMAWGEFAEPWRDCLEDEVWAWVAQYPSSDWQCVALDDLR